MLPAGVGHRTEPKGVINIHCHSSPEEGTTNTIERKADMRRRPAMVITLMQTYKQTEAARLHSSMPYHSMQSVQLPVVRHGEISSALC